jgi:hypothetical protein
LKRIGLISDTHGYLHPRVSVFFKDCDEIWHAGDIGNIDTADKLSKIKPLKAVFGNIDGQDVRKAYGEIEVFQCEKVKVAMIHIGGYPGKYTATAKELIRKEEPGLFISGHSHILKVMYDEKNSLLHINPGAAGKQGLHKKITMVRFIIDEDNIRDLELFEASR